MSRLFAQTRAITIMGLSTIKDRVWMSLAAVVAVAVVVGVLMAFEAMGRGFKDRLERTGSENMAVITRVGSRSEVNSIISQDQMNKLLTAPGIARASDGTSLASPELYVIVDGYKKATLSKVNLPLRGIAQAGIALRENVSITAGRMFVPGRAEIIVGESVLREFAGFELGKTVRFGKSAWTIVGTFSTGGSAFEGELWADARVLQSQFRRGASFQSMRVKLPSAGAVGPIRDFVAKDPDLNFDVVTEKDYFREQATGLDALVQFGNVLAVVMAVGALAGALNTMFTSVAARGREIATLRAIGFSGVASFTATLIESLLLALIGGLLGVAAAFFLFDGLSTSTLGESFTQVVFSFEFSPALAVRGIGLALLIGFVGGVFPAWRSSHLPVVLAFRG